MSSPVEVEVAEGHVALVLLQDRNSVFYLEIPLDIINNLCLKPLKYLLYLGWCILGAEGVLALEPDGDEIDTDEDLDEDVYHYVTYDELDLASIIDPEVIKTRTNVPSETTEMRNDFSTDLLERDVCCVWTGTDPFIGDGFHIIPYKRGSEWLQQIIENRPKDDENVKELNEINDIRNGVFANSGIHRAFDRRRAAILKTPNSILQTEDVPPRHLREHISEKVSYPPRCRYTLQWLVTPNANTMSSIPNNSDATFRKRTPKRDYPSGILLHYIYGAAAIKNWGRGTDVLLKVAKPACPRVPVPTQAGPQRTINDRTTAIRKREAADRRRAGALVESEDQETWDEYDMMLFLRANTKAAKERRLKKASEDAGRIEQWRGGVSQG
ncbi:hypothetical protein F5887DRAFT_1218252, partial [Amanita rubescens]